jgi:hypothetical protein
LGSIFGGKYNKDGTFTYEKYYIGKYRDGGCGPHMPKMPPINDFKQTIQTLLDEE